MAEGFGQATDRAFANYLAISRGSVLEAKSHLAVAVARKRIPADAYAPLGQEATELAKMLSAFIRYLRRSDWKDRF
jgi:four helix bundle protein